MISLVAPVLGLALAQVAPAAPQETPPAQAPGEVPAQPAPAPAESTPLPGAPDVRFERLADGGWRVTRDGGAVTGPDLYRAVLRFDLLEQAEERQFQRRALLVAAGAAVLAGPGVGWLASIAGEKPPTCWPVAPDPVSCQALARQADRENRARLERNLAIGGAAGLVVGGLLAWWGLSIEPLEPSAAEAAALVEAARGRWRAPPPRPPTVGLRLGVEPLPGGGVLVATWRR